jgi:FixJ family two-component response regulator
MKNTAFSLPLVAIACDHREVRANIAIGLSNHGCRYHPIASGQDLIDTLDYIKPDCILLDICLADIDGLATMRSMPRSARHIPVIFIIPHADIELVVKAMKAGAADVIEKSTPIDGIVAKIHEALSLRTTKITSEESTRKARELINTLTRREREIMLLVCEGLQSKEIAARIDLGVRTVESHRHHAIKKLGDSKLLNIVKMFQSAGDI